MPAPRRRTVRLSEIGRQPDVLPRSNFFGPSCSRSICGTLADCRSFLAMRPIPNCFVIFSRIAT